MNSSGRRSASAKRHAHRDRSKRTWVNVNVPMCREIGAVAHRSCSTFRLKRAAVLLFHPDPERFVTGASVKVGYFASETDLRYQDEIVGDLFTQVGKTMELLLTKYLKAVISYEGIQRIESFPMPEPALREALLSAIVHRDYAVAAPIQTRVYADRLSIWNPGELPEGWSEARLLGPHASHPFNPGVANTFFRAGEIEAWGRGIERVFEACHRAGTPEPRIRVEPPRRVV